MLVSSVLANVYPLLWIVLNMQQYEIRSRENLTTQEQQEMIKFNTSTLPSFFRHLRHDIWGAEDRF
jgi:hypothetical protein